jgi:hypothetical protein
MLPRLLLLRGFLSFLTPLGKSLTLVLKIYIKEIHKAAGRLDRPYIIHTYAPTGFIFKLGWDRNSFIKGMQKTRKKKEGEVEC